MNARKIALECLLTLSRSSTPIASVIDAAFKKHGIDGRERRLANGLIYGVVRWQRQLDWVLGKFISPKFRLDARHQNILRLGAFQLLHLDGIPAHAAIFETVQLMSPRGNTSSRRRKSAGFINAVLRAVQREGTTLAYPPLQTDPIEHIATSLSYPTWLVKRWIHARGVPWTLNFCQASNQPAPLAFRVNSLLSQPEDLRQFLNTNGLPAVLSKIAPDGVVLKDGAITAFDAVDGATLQDILNREDVYVQDESAMLVAHLLSPDTSTCVVDLCAAPGGKTTHLSHLMGNGGRIIATDVSGKKVTQLQENCRRVAVRNVETRVVDALKDDLSFIREADAVLIDAPCSGFGTFRRHPDIRWNKTFKQVRDLSELQYNLLKNAAPHIKPGGILVYSTCSTEAMENEEVVQRFLTDFPMFSIESVRYFLPDLPSTMITPQGFVQTFPHEHGVDGAFAARLRRSRRN